MPLLVEDQVAGTLRTELKKNGVLKVTFLLLVVPVTMLRQHVVVALFLRDKD